MKRVNGYFTQKRCFHGKNFIILINLLKAVKNMLPNLAKWAIRYGGYAADIWRKYGGHTADMRRIYGGYTTDGRQICGGYTADIRQTCGGHAADMRPTCG